MKLGWVARKTLLEIGREFQLLALMIGLPAFFTLINYFGYSSASRLVTYPILVTSSDPRSAALVESIQAQRYPDGRPAFQVRPLGEAGAADEQLKRQDAALLLDFRPASDGRLGLEVRGDATSMAYIIASNRLAALLEPQLDALSEKPQALTYSFENLSLPAAASDFELYTPGMMIFAILLLIPQTAMLLGREMRAGTLRRLSLTRLSGWELLGGVTLAQMAVGVVQVLAMFAMALALGFHNQGSLLLAIGLCLLLAVSAVGSGLWVAGFVSDDSQALNVGSLISMIQVFLSGAWFAMPAAPILTIAGHGLGIFDLLPATHIMIALKQVMVGGAGLGEVAFRVAAVVILAVVYFLIGVVLFRRQLR